MKNTRKKFIFVSMIFLGISTTLMYYCVYYIPFEFTAVHSKELPLSKIQWYTDRVRQVIIALGSIGLFAYTVYLLIKSIKFKKPEIMKYLRTINPANILDEVAHGYTPRAAARGIVFDQNNNVAILPVSNHNYYKLPGGGIEQGEDTLAAFRRECLEEIGWDVEVVAELGIIVEYRSEFSIIQTSYCYVGKVIGEKKEISLTDHEKSQGFKQPVWLSFEEAYKLVSTSEPNNYEGGFIKERDTLIFETARLVLEK